MEAENLGGRNISLPFEKHFLNVLVLAFTLLFGSFDAQAKNTYYDSAPSGSYAVSLPSPPPQFGHVITHVSCPGGSDASVDMTPTVGVQPYSRFDWSHIPGSNDPEDVSGLSAGTYVFRVRDDNDVWHDTTIVINEPADLMFRATIGQSTCPDTLDGSIDIDPTGGTAPYSFDWDNDGTGDFDDSEDLTGLPSGTYALQIRDANLCVFDTLIEVTSTNVLSFNAVVTQPSCVDPSSGAIDITPSGGAGAYSFDWDIDGTGDFDDTEDLSGLSVGTYHVAITDGTCTYDTTIVVTEAPNVVFNASITADSCHNTGSGAITLSPVGGTGTLLFDWDMDGSGDYDDTQDQTGLVAGIYTVSIMDDNLCVADTTIEIALFNPIVFNATIDTACFGQATGAISLAPTGGTAPYTFDWDTDGTGDFDDSQDIAGLAAGAYMLTIRDAALCTFDTLINVSEYAGITFGHVLSPVSCAGGNDGAIDLEPIGGELPYNRIDWSHIGGSSNPEDVTGLDSGFYNVRIRDGKNCWLDTTFFVPQPDSIRFNSVVEGVDCVDPNSASIDIQPSGGSGAFSYDWDIDGTGDFDDIEDQTALSIGSYTVAIQDANSCVLDTTISIEELTWTLNNTDVSCFGGNDGQADVGVSGGRAPFTYAWTGGSTNDTIFDLTAGKYYLTIMDNAGCTALDSVTIAEPTALAWTINSSDVSCFGGNDGQADVSVTGGTAPYTYAWTGGSTNDTIFDLTAGKYYLTIMDNAGCTALDSVTITEPTALAWTMSSTDVSCFGGNDGLADVSVTGGTAPYTYAWTGGSTNDTIFDLTAGKYYLTIMDNAGCTALDSVTITEPTALAWTINSTDVSCFGGNDGQADVSVSGGTAPYTYAWTGGSTNDTIFDLTAGKYYLTIMDNAGCTALDSVTIAEPMALAWTISSSDVSCFGGNDGQADVSVTGGTAPYTYAWTGGSTNDTIFDLTAGKYYLTIMDNSGCTALDSVTITEPTALAWAINNTDVSCFGGNDGQADVSVSGGTAPYTFAWTGGSTNDTIFDLTAGKYYLTIMDNAGCTALDSVTITEPTALAWTISSTDVSCFGGNDGQADVSVSGGTAPYTYAWTGGSTNDTIFDLTAGKYYLTIMDNAGCTALDSVTITEPTALAWTINSTDVSCFGGNDGQADVSVSGGTAPYTYAWTGGSTNDTIFDLTAGKYYLTIMDNAGCTALDSVTIAEPTALAWTINSSDVSCFGGNDGQADVSVSGGTAPYTYAWTGGSTNDTIFDLTAGKYYLTIMDNAGCTALDSMTIVQPDTLVLSEIHSDVTCFGFADGSIDLTVTGGSSPYTIDWDNDGTGDADDLEDLSGLAPGIYAVFVSDVQGCTAFDSIEITQPDTLVVTQSHVDVSCTGNDDGSIDLTITGGTAPYMVDWNNDGTGDADDTEDISSLAPGVYTVLIADANACTAGLSVTISEPLPLTLSETHNDVSCNGAGDGSIDLTIVGGRTPYAIDWDIDGTGDADDLEDISSLTPGSYTVIVSDSSSCTSSLTVNITQPAALTASETHVDVLCNGANTGSIDLTIAGGTLPYSIDWDNDGTGDADDTEDLIGIPAGTYTVTISDANGCSLAPIVVEIDEPTALSQSETHSDISCNGGTNGSIDLTVSGGVTPYSYDWSNDGTGDTDDPQDLTNLSAGTYTVNVSDFNGCALPALSVTLTQPTAITISAIHTNPTCNDGSDGTIDLAIIGGVFPYQYDWNTDGTGDFDDPQDLTGLASGTYTVRVRDANNCIATQTIVLTFNTLIVLNEVINNVSCNGDADGSIGITVAGNGQPPLLYDWSMDGTGDNDDTRNQTSLPAGVYTLIVTDNNGCTESETYTITEPTELEVALSKTNTTCTSLTDGTATATPSGGTAPYSISWSTGEVGATITGLSAGWYIATITDAESCSVVDSVEIPMIPLLSADANIISDYNGQELSCQGAADGVAVASPTGGSPAYTYAWSNGQTGATLNNVAAGTYTVTITDGRSCTAQDDVTFADPSAFTVSVVKTAMYNGADISCPGASDGALQAIPTNGHETIDYSWDSGQSTQSISGLSAGTYTVTATDDNGCVATANETLTAPIALAINLTTSDYGGYEVSCNGGNDGSITANVNGGTTPYSYAWSNGVTAQTNSTAGAGYHEVVVTDVNGCIISDDIVLDQPSDMNVFTATSAPSDCGVDDGIIQVNASGGIAPYEYRLGAAGAWQSSQFFSGLATGTYQVFVRSTTGSCEVGPVTSVVPAAEVPNIDNITIINPTTDSSNDGGLLIQASGNGQALQYRIEGITPWQSSNLFNGLDEGTITVQVRYLSQNCIAEEVITMVAGGGVVGTPSNTQICSQELNGTAFLETYYIPLAEDDVEDALQSIFPASCPRSIPSGGGSPVPSSPIISYNSIGVVEQGSVLFYDHWEDGYEANIEFPIQSTTEIWGDNDPSNGIAPGYATDYFNAADNIVLQSTVDVTSLGTIDFDGGDRFASRGDLSYSRMIWAQNSGTYFAGSAEVYATEKWGTSFQVPVGENITTDNLFEYTGANIVAGDNGATITITNGATTTVTLAQGENFLIDGGLNAGATITSDNPIHVILITGDVCENYESRFFTLTPTNIWSDNYYNPVSTEFDYQTYVFLYNPNGASITVQYEGSGGFTGSVSVPSGQVRNVGLPDGIGSHFFTNDGSRFYAIATIDSRDGSTWTGRATDWGYALLPYTQLSSQITLVGFAPGENPLAPGGINASPIWITADHPDGSPFAGNNIQLNIDLDGDDVVDLSPTIPEMGQYQIFDPSDNDQTGTRIWVADGSDAFIAGAYGQEPSIGQPFASALDLGTGLFNKIPFSAGKCVDLYTDYTGNGLYDECDEVIYTLIIRNTGSLPLTGSSVRIIDTLSSALTYIPNSTTTFSASGINTVADDGGAATPFPLDEGGYLFSDIVTPGDSVLVTFAATINDASSANFISNVAHIENINTSLSPEVSFPVQNPAVVSLPGIPGDTLVDCDISVMEPPYQDTCLSKLFIDQKNWNIAGYSTEQAGNEVALAIDGNADSYWLSNSLGALPQFITIDLGILENGILGVTYLPRQDIAAGRIADYQIYASNDGVTWGAPVATGTWADTDTRKDVVLNSIDAQYIRLVALSSTDGSNQISAAEITVQVCDQDVTYSQSTTQTADGSCTDYAYEITRDWQVENYCGNIATQSQTITVQDTVAPDLFGVPSDISVFPGLVPPPASPTATDNCDSSPTVSYDADTTMVGCLTYITRTWTATDACGNSQAESQVIEVLTCPEDCTNGIDDDGDGLIDCDDPDCINGLAVAVNNDTIVCLNETVDLSALASGGFPPYSYSWNHGLGAGANQTVTASSNRNYTVTVSDAHGCEATATVNVQVNHAGLGVWAFRNFSGSNVTITDGATYQLSSLPPTFNIQVSTTVDIGSAEIRVSGDHVGSNVDNNNRYRYPSDLVPFSEGIGTYTFCADLYAMDDAQGGVCETSCITFTLIDQEICYDGIDNDGDGYIDCEDGDCNGNTDCPDNDQDGITDDIDIDDDNDGILDVTENMCGSPCDTDGDGVPDYFDLDSDNDGIFDVVESGGPDANEDGIIGNGTFVDSDNDGWSDIADSDNGGGPMPDLDSDGDGIPDRVELDSDNDGCFDVIEAGYTDDDMDGILGMSPATEDFDGLVTSGVDGYTIPDDREPNGVYDFQEVHFISITCPADITQNVDPGSCDAVVNVPAPTVDNACGGYILSNDLNGGDDASGTFPLGTTTVQFTAVDSTGTTVTCSMNITIVDNEAPVPTLANLPDVVGQCSATATAPSATDNCSGALVGTTSDPTSYTTQGTYVITWVYTDGVGNTTLQSQTVIVDDNTAPVPDVATLPTINEECGATLTAPTATDNCAGPLTATTAQPTTYSAQGTYTVTWIFNDGNGNTRTQNQTVIIDDVTDPVMDVASLPTIVEQCAATLVAPTSVDNCSGAITASTTAPTTYTAQGTYTLTWIHNDGNGNVVTQSQTVIIDDTTSPVPDVASLPDALAECDTVLVAPTATDNCEGSITATTTDPVAYSTQGSYVVTWTYDDGNGNTSQQTQNVIIDDVTAPVPDLASLPDIDEECGVVLVAPTATDNCEGSITATTADPTSYSAQGSYTVTWTYDDGNGNTSQQTQSIDILDVTPPIAVCQNDTIDLGGGTVVLDPSVIDGGSTDNCPGMTLSVNPNTFSAIGVYTVTLTATDVAGNTDECTAQVTVEDTSPPTCLAIDTTLYLDASGMVSINSIDLDGGSTDNGVIVNYLASDTLFTCGHVAVPTAPVPVTLTLTDDGGNTSTCISQVTVLDTIAPQVICQDVTLELDSNGVAILNPDTLNFGSYDACNITFSADITDFDCSMTGDNTVILTGTDPSGNAASCTAIVTIEDNILPVMNCTPPVEVDNTPGECGAYVNYAIPSVTDNCSSTITAQPGSGHNPGDFFPIGTTWVGYYASNPSNGATVTCWFPVTVNDTEGPELVCPANDTVPANLDCQFVLGDYTSQVVANDNCASTADLSISQNPAPGTLLSGSTIVTFTVTDDEGNSSQCDMLVVVQDETDPEIDPLSCPGDQVVYLESDCTYEITDYTTSLVVTDNCTPDASISVVQAPAPGTLMTGHNATQTITLTATDVNGNESICSFVLTALDTIAPVIDPMTCPGDQTVSLNDTCYFLLPDYRSSVTVTDNCEAPVDMAVTQVPVPGTPITGDGTSQLVVITLDDGNGNSSTCEFTVTVQDTSQPVFVTCAINDTVSANDDCEFVLGDYTGEVTVTDNCGNESTISLSQDPAPGSTVSGTTIVVITAEDQNGVTNTCSFEVVVEDTTDPQIDLLTCPGDQDVYLDNGCEYVISDYTSVLNVSDNCTPTTSIAIVQSPAPGTLMSGHGDVESITLTATDANGNSSVCSFILTALDTITPSISCPGDITQNVDPGMPTAVVNYTIPVGTDNCVGSVTAQVDGTGYSSGSAFPVGTTTLTYVVTDLAGLTAECSFDITIIDNSGPEVTCPAPVDVDAPIGFCSTNDTILIPVPVATDNDGVASLINDYNGTSDASDIYPVGVNVVTWTATDNSGNTETCQQIIIVNDVEAPSDLVCPADTTISATIGECGIDSALVQLTWPTATDPCDTLFITNDAPGYYPVGETLVTWTIADSTGNAVYCTQSVTITDDELPTPDPNSCPEDQSVNVDAGECGTAAVNVTLVGPTATDPCGIFDVYNNAPDTFPVGTTQVTWYIEDSNGNIDSTCTQLITVIDNEDPVILDCPAPVDVDATLGQCGIDSALVSLGTLNATDPCGVISIANDAPDYYQVGQTIVTWTVTDSNGNLSTCEQVVTVHDIEAPSELVCPNDTLITATLGECGIDSALVDLVWPTATDPCDTLVITNDAPAYYPVGITLVTWTIADTSGNYLTCAQLVEIQDTEQPTMVVCPTDTVIQNDAGVCGAIYTYPTPQAEDNCGVSEVTQTQGLPSGSEFPVGDTFIVYEITDVHGNVTTCSFTVTVLDTEAPVFNEPVVLTFEPIDGECESVVEFNIPVAEDNCPGVITEQTDGTGLTSGDVFPVGVTTLTYLATDASGNTTLYDVVVTVEDTESPVVLTCPEDMTVSSDPGVCGASVSLMPPSAIDNCGTVSMTHDAPIVFPVGTTEVTWTISDQAGNTQYCVLTVTVIDEELPSITCPADMVLEAPWGACEITVEIDSLIATDNCGIASIENDFTATESASGVYPLGVTVVQWVVTDVNGNSSICETSITVNTSADPMITCTPDVQVNNDQGVCGAQVAVPAPEVEYDCSVVSVSNDRTDTDHADDFYPVGITVVTWTVTDISGNVSQCSTTIEVVDNEVPQITCPADISVPNDPGLCGAYVDYALPSVWDNCGIEELVLIEGVEPGGLFNDGTTVVSYLVTDIHGASAQCSFEVTVTDEEAPIIFCPADMVVIDSIVSYPYPDFTDNCYGELILIEGPDSGDEFDHGYTDVIFAAVDLYGNMDTCGFQVLVNTPPVAVNDTVIIFESDDEITIDLLDNDYDLDGDSIWVSGILFGSHLAFTDGHILFYDIPDNECGIDSVAYILTDIYGATDTAVVYVEVECFPSVFVPDGFSPNGDGVNDVLHILGLHEFPQNNLKIFNRYGHKVLDRNAYQNDWDGRSEASLTIGDTYLPRGTYFYILDIGKDNIQPLKGFIYINPR